MFNSIMSFIYQHPFISGFILYWSSYSYLRSHHAVATRVSTEEDDKC